MSALWVVLGALALVGCATSATTPLYPDKCMYVKKWHMTADASYYEVRHYACRVEQQQWNNHTGEQEVYREPSLH